MAIPFVETFQADRYHEDAGDIEGTIIEENRHESQMRRLDAGCVLAKSQRAL